MNTMGRKFLVAILLLSFSARLWAQGTFVNLNFEHAAIVVDPSNPNYPHFVFASSAIPFWTAYTYGTQLADILYDAFSLSSASVGIYDTNYPSLTPLQGRYTIGLMGQFPGSLPNESAAIAQTGQVPGTAKSLTFFGQIGGLQVTFGGQVLPYEAIGTGANYTIYSCDISAFAGQTGELRFTTLPNTSAFIDSIQLSPDPIPEPGVLTLSALGALVAAQILLRRRPCKS